MPALKDLKTLFRAKQATASLQTTPASEALEPEEQEDQQDQAPVPNNDPFDVVVPSWTNLPSPSTKDMITRPNAPVPPTPFGPKNETEREMFDDLRRLSVIGVCGGGEGEEEAVCSYEHDLEDDTSSIASDSDDAGSPKIEFKISRVTFLQFSPSSVLKESPTYYKSTVDGKPVNPRKARAVPESPCASRLARMEKEKGSGVAAAATSTGDDEGEEEGEEESPGEEDDGVVVEEISSRFIEVFSDSSEEEKEPVSTTSKSDEDEPEPVTTGTGTDLLEIPHPEAQVPLERPDESGGKLPAITSFTSTLVSELGLHAVKPVAPLASTAVDPAKNIPEDSLEEAAPYAGIEESPVFRQDMAYAGKEQKRGASPSLSSLASLVSIAVTLNSVDGYDQLPDNWTFEQKIAFVEGELRKPFRSLGSSQGTLASPLSTTSPTTSTQEAETGPASPPVSLSDLQILKVLGKGATSQVYMVRHKKWNTRHALKVAMNIYDEKGKERKSAVEWLKGEQGVMRKIGGNGGGDGWFLRLDASWSDTRNLYFLLPLYATDLDSEIQRCHMFPVRRARFYFSQLTIALHDLHSRGIIHRDVKPANIMLDYEGHIVLGDFGLSEDFGVRPTLEERTCQPYWPYWSTDVINQDAPQRPVDTLTFALTKFCGSPHHLAPEVWLEKPYSFGVDWWAAATVLFNMVTGRLPFWTSPVAPQYQLKAKVVSEDIYFRHGEKLDFWTKDILWKMLKKKPEERLPIMVFQSHPFFDKIDWDAMTRREVTPPFIPPRQPTHVINDRIVEFVRGNAFAEGGNPHPELEYTSSTMLTGMFEEKEKMRESDFDKDDLVGASLPKVQVLHHHELGLWGKICESSQEGIAFSMYYPPPVPAQRFYVNQDSVAAAYKAVMKNMDGAGMDGGSYDDGSSFSLGEQLGQWKDRIKCVFVPRARSRPVDEPRFDLLD